MDGGTRDHRIEIRSEPGEHARLLGASRISGWNRKPGTALWTATVPLDTVRDLFLNGQRRRRTGVEVKASGWVLKGEVRIGLRVPRSQAPVLAHPAQLELRMPSEWRDTYVPLDTIRSSKGDWLLLASRLDEASRIVPEATGPGPHLPFRIENAPELLKSPGEWAFDASTRTLSYLPFPGEDLQAEEGLVPVTETLFDLRGSKPTSPIRNLHISGLEFVGSAWNAPTGRGWYGEQSESLTRPFPGRQPSAAVRLEHASGISILGCIVRNTSAAGIALVNGVRDSRIEGNLLFDIGDAAILVSTPQHADLGDSSRASVSRDTLRDNLILRAGAAFSGAPAISAFYVDGLQISHNTIRSVPYSGISLGWGWEVPSTTCRNNHVVGNRIEEYLLSRRDGGGIYTLGNQPGTRIERNYLARGTNDFAALHLDEGSAEMLVQENVIEDAPRWLHIWTASIRDIELRSNWSTTDEETFHGTRIRREEPIAPDDSGWPATARAVIREAGIRPGHAWLSRMADSLASIRPSPIPH